MICHFENDLVQYLSVGLIAFCIIGKRLWWEAYKEGEEVDKYW